MGSNKLLTIIIIGSLVTGISMIIYFKPNPFPVWIGTEKIISDEPPEIYIEIREKDLQRFPQLAEIIQYADDAHWVDPKSGLATLRTPSGPMLKMDNEKGTALLELLGDEYQNRVQTYHFNVNVRDSYYILEMIFTNEPPKIA